DLTPTTNAARCTTATASSQQSGMYAGAAVDGNTATAWVPDSANGRLTTDLAGPVRVKSVTPTWNATKPVAYSIELSLDGRHWRRAVKDDVRLARYVRVTVRGDAKAKEHPGIAELTVNRAGAPGER
ncbi:discoidin domain-containing protein, partial [Streptomyces sp. YS-3]|uniref:discoidin domain-containing protein n=1 Tax=Streptomyces sp. YS-3 TaxID=3381352 RepID=UPI003862CBC7